MICEGVFLILFRQVFGARSSCGVLMDRLTQVSVS
jgi:hypothetical protein